MSLTKDEWAKMWESIKRIEYLAQQLAAKDIPFRSRHYYSRETLAEVRAIKRQIEQVIGQME